MRLALVIRSAYAENTVVAHRDAFLDNAALFAERFGARDAAFEVMTLDATRDLPEALEDLLRNHTGRLESLLVHFTGYIAVKADRGPALLLDGSRLRAFPLSRLRAAIEDSAQQALVIFDGLAVVDADQAPEVVAKAVGEALASSKGSIASLVGIEHEPPSIRRGPQRLTDLFVLAVDHLAAKARSGLVTDNAAYQAMQSDVLSFADIPGVAHHAGYFDFVLLPGPMVGGISEHLVGHERTTQPVPVYQARPTTMSGSGVDARAAGEQEELPRYRTEEEDDERRAEADEHVSAETDDDDRDTPVPPMAGVPAREQEVAPDLAIPITRGKHGERRVPTLADTPRARAARDWLSEAAYFPSAPPPPVTPVKPGLSRPPHAAMPGPVEDEPSRPSSNPRSAPSNARSSRPSMPSSPEEANSVIALYEDLLAQLDASEDPRRAEVHVKLGDALRDAQRTAEALFAYERALDIDPLQPDAFAGACELYRNERDFGGLVSTIRRKIEATDSLEERLALLGEIAEIWLTDAGDAPRAIQALEEYLALSPDDVRTLQMLIDACDRAGDVMRRLDSRERLAKSREAEPELRSAAWVEAATLAHDELNDLERTFRGLEAAISTGALLPHALARAEALLGRRERWLEVVELYEHSLETTRSETEAIQLSTRLVAVSAEHSCQDALKPESLSIIVRMAQHDPYLAQLSAGLVESITRGPETLELLQQVRVGQPRDPAMLHRLVALAEHEHVDVAANVASVLVVLGEATEQEAELAKVLSSDTLPTPARALDNADYDSLLFPPELDRDMTLGLARIEKILMAAQAFEKKSGNGIPKDAPVIDPETSTVTLARSFLWTARLLSVRAPELVLLADAPTLFRYLPQPEPRLLVSRSLGSGFSLPELVYLVARHATLTLPGFLSREHCAEPRSFGSLLYALGVVSDGRKHGVKSLADTDQQKLGKRLLAQLETDPSLDIDVDRVVGSETPTVSDCERRATDWLRAVDQVRLRAALLACGSPAIALDLNRKYPMESLWSEDEQLDILAAFAGSPEHCELRARLEISADRTTNFAI